jgi:hypothetical protein
MKINIDITDWSESYQSEEINVSNETEVVKRAKEGVKPSEMGRHIIVARELGATEDDIIKPNKTILNIGAAKSVSDLIARQMKEVNLKSGKSIKVRALVCATEDVEEDIVVDSDTREGYQNAVNYLLKVIPGYLQSRLAIIAANGEDVEGYWEQFKAIGDEIVRKLIELD